MDPQRRLPDLGRRRPAGRPARRPAGDRRPHRSPRAASRRPPGAAADAADGARGRPVDAAAAGSGAHRFPELRRPRTGWTAGERLGWSDAHATPRPRRHPLPRPARRDGGARPRARGRDVHPRRLRAPPEGARALHGDRTIPTPFRRPSTAGRRSSSSTPPARPGPPPATPRPCSAKSRLRLRQQSERLRNWPPGPSAPRTASRPGRRTTTSTAPSRPSPSARSAAAVGEAASSPRGPA